MIPLLRVSNIAVSDENSKSYVTIQLNGNMVVWVCSPSWTVLTHWEITDEVKHGIYHYMCFIWNSTVGFNIFLHFTNYWRCGSVYSDNIWDLEVLFHLCVVTIRIYAH